MFYTDLETNIKGVIAHVTYREQPNGTYVVRATPRFESVVENERVAREIKRVAKTRADVERVAQQAANEIARRVRDATSKIARANKGKAALQSAVAQAFYLLRDSDDPIKHEWDTELRRKVLLRFEHRVLPLLDVYPDDELVDLDRDRLRAEIEELVLKNPHSGEKRGNHRRTAQRYMAEAEVIYQRLRMIDPELPDIHFVVGRANTRGLPLPEQLRYLPEDVERRFLSRLKKGIKSSPKLVFGAVLMYDAGLRTGEAAAANHHDICERDSFSVVKVRCQEIDGKRDGRLKTEAAYRDVPLSHWAREMLKQCASAFGDIPPDCSAALVLGAALSVWIKRTLTECGFTPKFWAAAEKEMDTEPDDMFADDVTAYVLRRNAASRWLNTEAWTRDEIDACLGHEIEGSKRQRLDLRLAENMAMLAAKRERHICDDALSRHPAIAPITLRHGRDQKVIPFERADFINDADEPLLIQFSTEASELGEVISVTGPPGSIRNWSEIHKVFMPKNRVVIGNVLKGEKIA